MSLAPRERRTLPRGVRAALIQVRRDVPATLRGAWDVHPLERGEHYRSMFIGDAAPQPGGMWIRWGIVVKHATPERVHAMVETQAALESALGGFGDLPKVSAVLAANPPQGWLVLEAWPGMPLAAAEPTARAALLVEVARRAGRLERMPVARWPGQRWTGAEEAAQLAEVWGRAGEEIPGWVRPLIAWLRLQPATVPAHRDLHPGQVIVEGHAADRWIGWEQAGPAPPGFDLGNLLAHAGALDGATMEAVWDAYVRGGGRAARLAALAWEAAASVRLAGLTLQRATGDDPAKRHVPWLGGAVATREAAEGLLARARERMTGVVGRR